MPPDIRGTVTGVIMANDQMRDHGVIGFLRVEGRRDTGIRYDRADVTITDTTLIYQQSKGNLNTSEFNAVREGDTVEANFVGPVLERYPVHATAGRLVIHR
jgi:hypothetical protein